MRKFGSILGCLGFCGMLNALPVPAQPRYVARIVSCDGVFLAAPSVAVIPGQGLAENSTINIPAAGRADLLIYKDGHHERLTGPCLVRVGRLGGLVIHGGSQCLARQVSAQRVVMVLPQGGSMQSVGGSIAGISDPGGVKGQSPHSDEPRRPKPLRPPGATLSLQDSSGRVGAKAQAAPILVAQETAVDIRPTANGELAMRVSGTASATDFLLKGSHLETHLTLEGKQLKLPHLAPGAYRLVLSSSQGIEQIIPFRAGRAAQLQKLLANRAAGQEAVVIDGLDQLGFPSLAAQRAEILLAGLNYQDAGLRVYLQRLYTQVLRDSGRAEALRNRH